MEAVEALVSLEVADEFLLLLGLLVIEEGVEEGRLISKDEATFVDGSRVLKLELAMVPVALVEHEHVLTLGMEASEDELGPSHDWELVETEDRNPKRNIWCLDEEAPAFCSEDDSNLIVHREQQALVDDGVNDRHRRLGVRDVHAEELSEVLMLAPVVAGHHPLHEFGLLEL